MEPESIRFALRDPIGARGLEQIERADDIGFHEIGRSINRTVHMAFGGKMHDRIGFVTGKNRIQRFAIANIDLFKAVIRFVSDRSHIVQASGIGQRVQIDDVKTPLDRLSYNRGSDEACATCYQNFHVSFP